MIEIWEPRWKDKTVLIAKYKVRGDVVAVKFTKAPSLGDEPYSVRSADIVQCPVESNGSIDCYVVPLDTVVGKRADTGR